MKADFKNIFQASYKDSQMKLHEAILVIFLPWSLNKYLFSVVFSKATTQMNLDKCLYLNIQEFSWKYIEQVLYSKLAVLFIVRTRSFTKRDSRK